MPARDILSYPQNYYDCCPLEGAAAPPTHLIFCMMVCSCISRDNYGESYSLSTSWVNQLMDESFTSTHLSKINPNIIFSMRVTLIVSCRHYLFSF